MHDGYCCLYDVLHMVTMILFVIVLDENGEESLQLREGNYVLAAGQVNIPSTNEYQYLKIP